MSGGDCQDPRLVSGVYDLAVRNRVTLPISPALGFAVNNMNPVDRSAYNGNLHASFYGRLDIPVHMTLWGTTLSSGGEMDVADRFGQCHYQKITIGLGPRVGWLADDDPQVGHRVKLGLVAALHVWRADVYGGIESEIYRSRKPEGAPTTNGNWILGVKGFFYNGLNAWSELQGSIKYNDGQGQNLTWLLGLGYN